MNARLAIGRGAGRLARRSDGLLFVATLTDPDRWAPLIDAYLAAPEQGDAREVVTSAAIAAGFALDPFVMIAWGREIELLVLGEVTVQTDLPSVPMLSGATSATWVEHRVVRPPLAARLSGGAPGEPGTRLDAGVVSAGGFALTLSEGAIAPRARAVIAPEPPPTPAPMPLPDAIAILDAATGGDWMEESLDLHGGRDHVSAADAADDPEATLSPPPVVAAPARPSTRAPAPAGIVRARRCVHGHPNPPHVAQCRVCGELIGPASVVETIGQPVLGHLVLPDGKTVALDGVAVVGRNPDAAAGRVDGQADLIALDVGADVSRTHLVLRAEGWAMTVTDCGSRGRTVLRSPGAFEPEALEPWVPHEVAPGDTLYLGGPTHLQVVAAT